MSDVELYFNHVCVAAAIKQIEKIDLERGLSADMREEILKAREMLKEIGRELASRRLYTLTRPRNDPN